MHPDASFPLLRQSSPERFFQWLPANYPDINKLLAEIEKLPNRILIDADKIAAEMNAKKSVNMVLLGAACPFLGVDSSEIEKAVTTIFGRKGEKVVQQNLDAIQAGREAAMHSCK